MAFITAVWQKDKILFDIFSLFFTFLTFVLSFKYTESSVLTITEEKTVKYISIYIYIFGHFAFVFLFFVFFFYTILQKAYISLERTKHIEDKIALKDLATKKYSSCKFGNIFVLQQYHLVKT